MNDAWAARPWRHDRPQRADQGAVARRRPSARPRLRSHTLALHEDGSVSAFGRNNYGQLGLGDTTDRNAPTKVPSLAGVRQLVPGVYHAGAARGRQRVRVWSEQLWAARPWRHDRPQRADQGAVARRRPSARRRLCHTLALHEDGSVSAFGRNNYGQLGLDDTIVRNGRPRCRRSPASVSSSPVDITRWRCTRTAACPRLAELLWAARPWRQDRPQRAADQGAVARRRPSARRRWISHAGAARGRQRVRVWSNFMGSSALATRLTASADQVPSLAGVRQLVAGGYHTLALHEDGSVSAFGANHYGQLGLGDTTSTAGTRRPRCRRLPVLSS